jgi:hypothetical protein
MPSSVKNLLKAAGVVAVGVGLCAAGIYVGHTDDAPPAGLMGILLLLGSLVLAYRVARRKA